MNDFNSIPAHLFAKRIKLLDNTITAHEAYANGSGEAEASLNAFDDLAQFDTDHPEVMSAVNYWHENSNVKE